MGGGNFLNLGEKYPFKR